MKILFLEMRRYLRPLTLTVAGVLAVSWVMLFSGAFQRPSYRNWGLLSVEYQQRFGDVIDLDELAIIKQDYDDLCTEIDGLIETCMGEYDVHSLEDYWLLSNADYDRETENVETENYPKAAERWGADHLDELRRQCDDIYWHGAIEPLAWRAQDIRRVIEHFELMNDEYVEAVRTNDPEWGFDLNEYQKERMIADIQSGKISVMNAVMDESQTNFRDSFQYYAILSFILCALFTVPFLTGNRVTGVQAMQFTTKSGRPLLHKQLGAALAIAAVMNVLIDAFFYIAYFYYQADERHYLLNCRLNMGAARNQLWLNLTYGQYVLLIFAKVLLLSLTLTAGLFIVSYVSQNYIVAMTVAVPSVIAVSLLSEHADYHMYLDDDAVWEYPVMLLLPIAAVLSTTVLSLRKILREDYAY